ncbi:MAG: hypothetical protein JWO76_1534 [Nocardioides sp.]|nr:hypothetical protein [Nocardioides sp.]
MRATTPGWRDPRLWIGVLIVAVSVVAGARLLGSADDTVSVWAAATDLGAGDRLAADDLVATRVRFADGGDLDGYFTVDDELPADLELTRGVGAGELLPRGAVGSAGESRLLQVPIAVDAEQVPGSVESGSVVDVYLVPSSASGARSGGKEAQPPGPALSAVTVVEAPPLDEGFAATGKRQLVLAVDDDAARRFFSLLGSLDSPVVTIVRRG